jgi:hypothetical protein
MKGCKHCGGPKPPGQGRGYCSPECRKLGPATGTRHCEQCETDALVPAQITAKARFCKACLKARARAYAQRHYAENRDKVRAAVRAYRESHAEEIAAYKRAHYQANREEIRAKQAAHYRENKQAGQERSHRWYVANRDRHKEATRRYRETHRELVRERNRRWYQDLMADPERRQARLELARMDGRLRAEKQGGQLKPVPLGVYRKRYGTGRGHTQTRVNAAPLRRLLREAPDLDALAQVTGLSASFLQRVAAGRYEAVSVPDADTICCAFGLPMSLIYGAAA